MYCTYSHRDGGEGGRENQREGYTIKKGQGHPCWVRLGSDRVRRGSDRVRCGSDRCGVAQLGCGAAQIGCSVAQIGCGVAQIVARRLAELQA
jgi:hypothetical protein